MMNATREVLTKSVSAYPSEFRDSVAALVDRVEHDLGLLQSLVPPGARVWDIGGGSGLFGVCAAGLGLQMTNIDDYRDLEPLREPLLEVQSRAGVDVVERDILVDALPPTPPLDAITMFHVIEHMHNSPRALLRGLVERLKPGGAFILSGPNAANLRKRVQFPLGRVGWSPLSVWYDQPVMRGHTREPLAQDLTYIAEDLGLGDIRVFGRNFLGRSTPVRWRRMSADVLDRALRQRPSLCSDLYLVGRRGAS